MILPLSQWPKAGVTIARTFGGRGIFLRALHEARRRSHSFRARPRFTLTDSAPPVAHPFRIDPTALAPVTDRAEAIARADRVLRGEHQAFCQESRPLPGSDSSWHRHPVTGAFVDPQAPWWTVSHLDPAVGDIKDLWEPARFAWVYDLVRAYLITGDDRYAHAFHGRFGQWSDANPPFSGVHWSCGQETTIRAVALLYAEANLADAPSSDRVAMERLANRLAASGERVADAIGYAISQRNNHAISEAVGLLVLGARFQRSHPEAERWYRTGRRLLERLIREQFAEDGWYIQHSFTYLRLALDQCVIAQRVLRTAGESLSAAAVGRLRSAVCLLGAVVDPASGIVPNHGANDGAFVHPITLATFRDFRPVLSAVCASFAIEYPCELQVDREVLAWLGLPEPPRSRSASSRVMTGTSGWAAARIGNALAFMRAGRYASRPGHLDPLHLDVRFGSHEIVVDPGTFAYNASAPWCNGLTSASVHNGVMLDDVEPGVHGPRFLWLIWPTARIVHAELEDNFAVIVAEIPDRVRRVVRVTPGEVVVEDIVLACDAKRARLRWLLHPNADPRSVRVEGGSRVLEAREGSTPGWFSPHYGERLASRYIEVERDASPGTRIITHFSET